MAFAPKGAYNRALIFNGDHFDYWKSSMRIHINSFDGEVWNAIENGPFFVIHINSLNRIVPSSRERRKGPLHSKREARIKERKLMLHGKAEAHLPLHHQVLALVMKTCWRMCA
ncbi:hypothetical protein QL285_046102 [Trifolium repens]|nr:hypothetical protein QL285_046102 [Trifolium repens]